MLDLELDEIFKEGIATPVRFTAGEVVSKPLGISFTEEQEIQTVRRARIQFPTGDKISQGDVFEVQGHSWRVLYQSQTYHGVDEWFCHEQLPELVTVRNRVRSKSQRGADEFNLVSASPELRAKIHRREGEVETNRRRVMRSEFWIYFEEDVRPTTDQVIVAEDGKAYQVESYQSPQSGEELPFVIAVASDG